MRTILESHGLSCFYPSRKILCPDPYRTVLPSSVANRVAAVLDKFLRDEGCDAALVIAATPRFGPPGKFWA